MNLLVALVILESLNYLEPKGQALALQIVIQCLLANADSYALWIDTSGDFSAEKTAQLVRHFDIAVSDKVLERLQVSLSFDIEAVHDVLEALHISLLSSRTVGPIVRWIVIDSITPLLLPSLSAVSSQGHAIMTTFMRRLRELARAFGITIMVRLLHELAPAYFI
jgi:RAD51-like protein 3